MAEMHKCFMNSDSQKVILNINAECHLSQLMFYEHKWHFIYVTTVIKSVALLKSKYQISTPNRTLGGSI